RFLPSHAPRIVSVEPWVSLRGGTGYISAVSMKFIPFLSAHAICECASLSVFCSPQVIVPRQMSETSIPLAPRRLRFMGGDLNTIYRVKSRHEHAFRVPRWRLCIPARRVSVLAGCRGAR